MCCKNIDAKIDKLEKTLDKAEVLTTKKRNNLDTDQFAVPGKRKLPIHDCNHARNAAARLPLTKGLTDEEKRIAKQKIQRAMNRHCK